MPNNKEKMSIFFLLVLRQIGEVTFSWEIAMKNLYVLSILMFLSACAQSSGILKMGPDTYSVSVHAAPARGGESGARRLALTEANEKCSSEGREIVVTNISSGQSSHFPGGTVEVTFRCLAKGDPDLQRPTYRTAPSTVIEDRRN